MEVFANIDECLNHFIERGFKLVKDTENYGSRTLSLRRYADGEPFEVIIKHVGTNISVVQTVNGKLVETL